MTNNRKELAREVQTRLNAGESKQDIYSALKGKFHAASVERSLAQWPCPADKEKNRYLNYPLLIIAGFFAILKILLLIGMFRSAESSSVLPLLPVTVIPILLYIYVIYGIKNCNLFGYLLMMLLSIQSILSLSHIGFSSPKAMMLFAMSAAALLLSWLQKTRLFPNTSIFLRHKRDADGNILF